MTTEHLYTTYDNTKFLDSVIKSHDLLHIKGGRRTHKSTIAIFAMIHYIVNNDIKNISVFGRCNPIINILYDLNSTYNILNDIKIHKINNTHTIRNNYPRELIIVDDVSCDGYFLNNHNMILDRIREFNHVYNKVIVIGDNTCDLGFIRNRFEIETSGDMLMDLKLTNRIIKIDYLKNKIHD